MSLKRKSSDAALMIKGWRLKRQWRCVKHCQRSTVLAPILPSFDFTPSHFLMLITFDCDRPAKTLMALRTGIGERTVRRAINNFAGRSQSKVIGVRKWRGNFGAVVKIGANTVQLIVSILQVRGLQHFHPRIICGGFRFPPLPPN